MRAKLQELALYAIGVAMAALCVFGVLELTAPTSHHHRHRYGVVVTNCRNPAHAHIPTDTRKGW